MARGNQEQKQKPRVVTAVVVPDPRVNPDGPATNRVAIVAVVTDDEFVWHCYPDGECVCYELPKIGPRRAKSKLIDR